MSQYFKDEMIELYVSAVKQMLFLGYTPEGLKDTIDKIVEEEK